MRFMSILLLTVVPVLVSAGSCFADDSSRPSEAFEVEAWAFDRGNFAVFLDEYRNGGPPIIANGGVNPSEVEYDIPFPAAGKYSLAVFAAMSEIRPLTVYLQDEKIGVICNERRTPTWNSIDAVWYDPVELVVPEAGMQTVRITTEGSHPPPHLARLRFTSENPLPSEWKLERPTAQKLPAYEEQYQGETNLTAADPKPEAIRRAIVDLIETYDDRYPNGGEYLKQLDALVAKNAAAEELSQLRYEAVFLANPVLDFDEIYLVRRHNKGYAQGFPLNWESNSSLPKSGYDDEIMTLDIRSKNAELRSFYKPPRDTLISDLCLDFDASRLMFSAVGNNDRWHIFEVDALTKEAAQITSGDADVDFYDSCYLPDGRIIMTCTAAMVGVPCVAGSSHVANLFLLDPKTKDYRQLCFDQEHNWCPRVLNNGRVLFTRWEYADTPHSNTRFLFHCNPDGTSQLEYYGSNSYWPNSIFYTRPLPNHPTKVIGVISGHHDNGRTGELVILDPAISRYEADGAVQKVPGYGKKVEAVVVDGLTRKAWPKFAHPAPLSDKYFLVSAKPTPELPYGIYFIDVFDNMILVKELAGNALVEPIPVKATKSPPVIADRVDLTRDDANIYISDIYQGPGLTGIPRGTVKALKVYTYHYAYHNTGGLLGSVGQDGPWDIRAVLGTVPVEADGSVNFRVPANLPIAVLPLDAHGQAMQLMRSWMTPMPGENLHCTGCHESQNTTPPMQSGLPLALNRMPTEITPYNPPNPNGKTLLEQLNVRGFSFQEQVQPVLDAYCVSCHNGEADQTANTKLVNNRSVGTAIDGKPFAINLRGDQMLDGWTSVISGNCGEHWGGKWTIAYDNLQRFVRRPGIESDYGPIVPMEFSANTTELVQLLKQGHYGVELDPDSWNRLLTWIDMNTPYHGNWTDANTGTSLNHIAQRRVELTELYGAVAVEFEKEQPAAKTIPVSAVVRRSPPMPETKPIGFAAMTSDEIKRIQQNSDSEIAKTLDLGGGLSIPLVRIPAYGELDKPFWMGTFEITNAQFRQFDPAHNSMIESRHMYQFGRRGYDVNDDELPVVRINWNRANDFCRWLSEKTSLKVDLPTERQWEYACRAGTTTPFWFGDLDADFSRHANFGDYRLKEFVADTSHRNYTAVYLHPNPNPFDDRLPKDERFNDGSFLHTQPGTYLPNPFGLYDMHGNVAEWTRSELQPSELLFPGSKTPEKIVKGGSWYDRPYRCTSDFRVSYPAYQPVFNVGFRIVVEE
ncbi:MAG: SUMF1/EgtB/PvdO family nonheme iron enzyme [Planctomycetaceae bacterium]|nr:SUMF1/EgtB/PvdO family nonheme iron enzyme [Planctomycetaceae bacterium]